MVPRQRPHNPIADASAGKKVTRVDAISLPSCFPAFLFPCLLVYLFTISGVPFTAPSCLHCWIE